MRLRSALIGVGVAVLAVTALAQSPSAGSSFDAVSIKVNKSGDSAIGGGGSVGTAYRVTNIPLRVLISQAYAMRGSEVIGGPAWLDTDRFDIVGKMPRPGSPFVLVRAMLADRFKLVTHKETRQLPIYALVIARRDGRLPNFSPQAVWPGINRTALPVACGRGPARSWARQPLSDSPMRHWRPRYSGRLWTAPASLASSTSTSIGCRTDLPQQRPQANRPCRSSPRFRSDSDLSWKQRRDPSMCSSLTT